jgi:NitT/TauT family transport system substrate-binding protein
MSFQSIARLIIAALLLTACAGSPSPTPAVSPATPTEQTMEQVRLGMGFIPNVQFAPFYVALEKGYFRDAGIDLVIDYDLDEVGNVALVGNGDRQFTVASAEQIMLARSQGLPVVYVLNWWRNYPVAVAALAEANIHTPADLAGKTIGLPGLFGASYIGLIALLESGGLAESDVKLDAIGYNQVDALVTGREDAVVVYTNNEPVQLKLRGYDVTVLPVADYAQLASNGLVTNQETIDQNPDLVSRMVQATLRGISDTLANPDEAFEISKKYVEGLDANADVQREILQATLSFWDAEEGELGASDPQAWENMQQILLDMELLSEPVDLDKAFTNAFIEP